MFFPPDTWLGSSRTILSTLGTLECERETRHFLSLQIFSISQTSNKILIPHLLKGSLLEPEHVRRTHSRLTVNSTSLRVITVMQYECMINFVHTCACIGLSSFVRGLRALNWCSGKASPPRESGVVIASKHILGDFMSYKFETFFLSMHLFLNKKIYDCEEFPVTTSSSGLETTWSN